MASERTGKVTGECEDEGGLAATHCLVVLQCGSGDYEDIDHTLVERVEDCVEEKCAGPRSEQSLDIWLESYGGDAHAAYKLILVLRERFHRIRVVVPYRAKSAGTLIALGGEQIFMTPCAELGPIDAQVRHPERERERVSALDIARSLESLSDTAVNIVLTGGGQIFKFTQIERTEAVASMLDFGAEFMAPIIGKLDPSLLHRARRQLDIGRDYACRLIAWHLTDAECYLRLDREDQENIKYVAARFVDDYPAHEFVISLDEVQALGLRATDIEAYERRQAVVALAKMARRQRTNIVDLFSATELDELESRNESIPEEDGEEQKGGADDADVTEKD